MKSSKRKTNKEFNQKENFRENSTIIFLKIEELKSNIKRTIDRKKSQIFFAKFSWPFSRILLKIIFKFDIFFFDPDELKVWVLSWSFHQNLTEI